MLWRSELCFTETVYHKLQGSALGAWLHQMPIGRNQLFHLTAVIARCFQ